MFVFSYNILYLSHAVVWLSCAVFILLAGIISRDPERTNSLEKQMDNYQL